MSFKVTGFKELEKELKKMQQGAKELERTKEIPFSDLFTLSFMRKYTNFESMDQLIEAGGFDAENFEDIPDEPFDVHIASTTKFFKWEDMLNKATELYISRKLGFK